MKSAFRNVGPPSFAADRRRERRFPGWISAAALFTTALCHGLSASEIGLLTRSDVRLAAGWIRIPRLKNSASEYPLLPAEVRALRAQFRVRGRGPGPLDPSRQQRPISRRRRDALTKQYCRIAGIDPVKAHFHVFKQSCAEHVRQCLGDPVVVRDWLGYEDRSHSWLGTQWYETGSWPAKYWRDATAERLSDFGVLAA